MRRILRRVATHLVFFVCIGGVIFAQHAPPNSNFPPLEKSNKHEHSLPTVQSIADSGISVLGHWAWGACRAVELTGHYALIGQGSVYQVLDISNPTNPTVIYDTTFDDWVKDIKIKDSLLVLAFSHEFIIFDATSPFPLKEIGRSPYIGGFPVDMVFSDSLLFVLADFAGVLAYNISNPVEPQFRKQFPLIDEDALAIESRGQYVYYGPAGPGLPLIILRYRSDSSFVQKGLDVGSNASALHLRDTLLFVGNLDGDLRIYSISDPWNPQIIDSINLGTRILRITTKGENVYCSTKDSSIVVLRTTNGQNPTVVAKSHSEFPPGSPLSKFALNDSILVESRYKGLACYSIFPPDSIGDLSFFPTGGEPTDIKFKGDIGFVTCGSAGLWSVDFSNSGRPQSLSNIQTAGNSVGIAVDGNIACCIISAGAFGVPDTLAVIEFTDSGSLNRRSSLSLEGAAASLIARDTLAFVGTNNHVSIISIADVTNPHEISRLSTQGTTFVGVIGNYLYAGDAGAGEVKIIDVSIPTSPFQVGSISSLIVGLLAKDNFLFIADSGLVIVDVSDPLAPRVISAIPTSGSRSSVRLATGGNFVYMVYDGLHVVDISSITQPREVASLLGNSFPRGVAVNGDTVYVVSPDEGVWIVKNNMVTSVPHNPELPMEYSLFQNYPNPFNPQTEILFKVPRAEFITIKVYDIFGKEVATLVNCIRQAGEYRIEWNGSGHASGVYYYQLTSGEVNITRKMLLLR